MIAVSAIAAGQSTGSLSGTVKDQSGAVVPGATVQLAPLSGRPQTTASAIDGAYNFPNLAPGRYTIQATAPQLKTPRPVAIRIRQQPAILDLELRVVLADQNIAVEESSAAAVSTDPSANASATVLAGRDLDALADDPNDLAADLRALAGPSAGPSGGEIYVDGFSRGELPSKDAIREVRVNQNPFSAEYDKLGLGRIEIFTKPGADKFRGSVFYNFAHDAWNSRNPYAAEKAPFFLREWGGNLGGPLGKKTSFFVDTRRDTTDNGAIVNAVVVDPATARPAPFSDVFEVRQRGIRVSPRIDHQLNSNHTLTFRYGFNDMDVPGAGVGNFNLRSRAFDAATTNHTVQLSETAIVSARLINEVRFQYFRNSFRERALGSGPAIQVTGAFIGGAAQVGNSFDAQNNLEWQDNVSFLHENHTMRFGIRVRAGIEDTVSQRNFNGAFIFSGGVDAAGAPLLSIEQYRRALIGQALPTQFTYSAGDPALSAHQVDLGAFFADDWRVRHNLTLSLGLRYETQTNIRDWRDFAPRVALAWAPGHAAKGNPKTVFRAGFGLFYDRFALANTLTALRFNGSRQRQYVIVNPTFFPTVPDLSTLAPASATGIVQQVSGNLRAPYLMQSVVSLERELPWKTSVALTYANTHGLHMLRSRDINAPTAPGSYPLESAAPLFQMESGGLYNQNQLLVNVTTKATKHLSLTGNYMLNRARSNTDGVASFPANQYDLTSEYGPAATDIRRRVSLAGTVEAFWNIRLNPLVTLESGPPFNITSGQDLYGTTLLNARPALVTDPTRPGVVPTSYGLLDPTPRPGDFILPRNYGRGPGQIMCNLRVAKTVPFGKSSLVISMSIRNLLNHTNPGAIIGNITSPLFGRANQSAGAQDLGGGGFSEAANNRRLELQVRLNF